MDDLGYCEHCKETEIVSLYRGLFLCWDCKHELIKQLKCNGEGKIKK